MPDGTKIIVYGKSNPKLHPAMWPNTQSLALGFQQLGYDVLLCDYDNYSSFEYCLEHLLVKDDIAFIRIMLNSTMERTTEYLQPCCMGLRL